MEKNIVAIVQARMGSRRFPEKMGQALCGYSILQWVVRRTKQSKKINKIVLATSVNKENDSLAEEAKKLNIEVYRGEEENVLSRFVNIAKNTKATIIVRICADNTLICASEIDRAINFYLQEQPDYAFNHIPKLGNNYIDGLGAEVFACGLLFEIDKRADHQRHFEHVTVYLWENRDNYDIRTINAPPQYAHPHLVFDVNTRSQLNYLEKIIQGSGQSGKAPEQVDVHKIVTKILAD